MAAPVTVIIAYDLKFYDKLSRLFPHYPAMRDMFVNNPQLIQETALRNSTLQGAYMILAARALGLDCGPMSGFDNAKLDEEFFAVGKCESCEQEFFPEGHVKSTFLCNIGYGDPAKLLPRGPSARLWRGMYPVVIAVYLHSKTKSASVYECFPFILSGSNLRRPGSG